MHDYRLKTKVVNKSNLLELVGVRLEGEEKLHTVASQMKRSRSMTNIAVNLEPKTEMQ